MIKLIDLDIQQKKIKKKLEKRIADVLTHGQYIMGPEVYEFENKVKDFLKIKHVISCANGTDALLIALLTINLQPGDIVFCPSFTFAATAEVIPSLGGVPFFIDVNENDFLMDPVSLERSIKHTKKLGLKSSVIIPVDLFGCPVNHESINKIAKKYNLKVLGDCAQSFGSSFKNISSSNYSEISATSFFPAKPLGCYGDGGAILTNDDLLAEKARSLRIHGKGDHKYQNKYIGTNSRLDTIQAAILIEKLVIFKEEIKLRNIIAQRYIDKLSQKFKIQTINENSLSVWAQFTLFLNKNQDRNSTMDILSKNNIQSAVYYPIPLHKQDAYKKFPIDPNGLKISEMLCKSVLSLPMHPYLDKKDQNFISKVLLEDAIK